MRPAADIDPRTGRRRVSVTWMRAQVVSSLVLAGTAVGWPGAWRSEALAPLYEWGRWPAAAVWLFVAAVMGAVLAGRCVPVVAQLVAATLYAGIAASVAVSVLWTTAVTHTTSAVYSAVTSAVVAWLSVAHVRRF